MKQHPQLILKEVVPYLNEEALPLFTQINKKCRSLCASCKITHADIEYQTMAKCMPNIQTVIVKTSLTNVPFTSFPPSTHFKYLLTAQSLQADSEEKDMALKHASLFEVLPMRVLVAAVNSLDAFENVERIVCDNRCLDLDTEDIKKVTSLQKLRTVDFYLQHEYFDMSENLLNRLLLIISSLDKRFTVNVHIDIVSRLQLIQNMIETLAGRTIHVFIDTVVNFDMSDFSPSIFVSQNPSININVQFFNANTHKCLLSYHEKARFCSVSLQELAVDHTSATSSRSYDFSDFTRLETVSIDVSQHHFKQFILPQSVRVLNISNMDKSFVKDMWHIPLDYLYIGTAHYNKQWEFQQSLMYLELHNVTQIKTLNLGNLTRLKHVRLCSLDNCVYITLPESVEVLSIDTVAQKYNTPLTLANIQSTRLVKCSLRNIPCFSESLELPSSLCVLEIDNCPSLMITNLFDLSLGKEAMIRYRQYSD